MIKIIALFALILIVTGCEPVSNSSNECKQFIDIEIPTELALHEGWPEGYSYSNNLIPAGWNTWRDGTVIEITPCRPITLNDFTIGNLEGENINYYYMRGQGGEYCYKDYAKISRQALTYSKQVVDDNGQILGYNTFGISPILHYTNRTITMPIGVSGVTSYIFEIRDYSVVNCKLIASS